MVDVIYIATLIGFFGLMVAFVHWCEHIIGGGDRVSVPFDGDAEDEDADVGNHGDVREEVHA